jgi:AcrR family transcriptional regulator
MVRSWFQNRSVPELVSAAGMTPMPADVTECESRARSGRPLDPTRDDAIRAVVLQCLAEVGYEQLTMDMVAARARAGKGALYRRWASKTELVVDAVNRHRSLDFVPTGSLRGDLDALISALPDRRRKDEARVYTSLLAVAQHNPELARAIRAHFMEPRHSALRRILELAAERGELSPTADVDLIVEIIPAIVSARLLLAPQSVDAAFIARLINNVVYPLAAGAGALVPSESAC